PNKNYSRVPTLFEFFRGLRGCRSAWNLGHTSKISVICAYLAKTRVEEHKIKECFTKVPTESNSAIGLPKGGRE
ncbi:MAG: hypothetical protein ACLQVJ_07685, partial [Syntrophobacteraceae bacterium]